MLKAKSGGESQTPYYGAIAASFYHFYKARHETTVRLVIFDEAFNRMDDERIGKILSFYDNLNLQIITSVPPEKIEAIAPLHGQNQCDKPFRKHGKLEASCASALPCFSLILMPAVLTKKNHTSKPQNPCNKKR
jgi:hypothetical protein